MTERVRSGRWRDAPLRVRARNPALVTGSRFLWADTIYRADNRAREIVKQVGGWGGAYLGGRLGASLGAKVGMTTAIAIGQAGPQVTTPEELITVPVFGIIGGISGGVVGGISGAIVGAKTTETVYDWSFTPLEKEEWEVGCVQ